MCRLLTAAELPSCNGSGAPLTCFASKCAKAPLNLRLCIPAGHADSEPAEMFQIFSNLSQCCKTSHARGRIRATNLTQEELHGGEHNDPGREPKGAAGLCA